VDQELATAVSFLAPMGVAGSLDLYKSACFGQIIFDLTPYHGTYLILAVKDGLDYQKEAAD